MKPSWDEAPDWATHLAQDSNGGWNWHGCKPSAVLDGYWSSKSAMAATVDDWKSTLEARPCSPPPSP